MDAARRRVKIDAATLAKMENPYNDITPAHWAYADIIEASVAYEYRPEEKAVESQADGK
jgi:hypothetical protein